MKLSVLKDNLLPIPIERQLTITMKSRLLICTFAFLFVNTAFAANYGDVTVQHVPLVATLSGTQATTHGMIEHRFRVQNRSTSATRTVSIQLNNASYAEYGLRSAVGSVEVPAGQTAQIVIMQPPVPMHSIEATVRINGYTQNQKIRIDLPTMHCDPYSMVSGSYSPYSSTPGATTITVPSNAHILVSGKTGTAFRDLFSQGGKPDPSDPPPAPDPAMMPFPSAGMGMGGMAPGMSGTPTQIREISLWRSEGDLDQWSDNWLALTRFDAVVVTAEELATIPETQPIFRAIRRYVECGGMLCVIGTEWNAPKEWKEIHSSNDFTQWDAVIGNAFLLKKPAEASEEALTMVRNLVLSKSDNWTGAMRSETYYGRYGGGFSGGGSGFFGDPRRLVETMPTSESKGVPIRAITVLILVFAILIGPVNVYVLSWKNRRIWLLWTVPVISLLASGLVLGTNFTQEGFVRYTSVSSVTILDQRREEALTFGIVGFYSTLTPRGGCLFDSGTEPTIIANRSRQTYSLISYPGGEQNLTSGWIQPRVPAYFGVRKAATEIRGLEFNWAEETPTVVNQLGVDLEKLIVCSPEGTFYEAEKIVAGQKTTLQKFATAPASTGNNPLSGMVARFDNWPNLAETILRDSTQILERGSYLVSLGKEKNPFLEPGISDAKPFRNKSVIVGFY